MKKSSARLNRELVTVKAMIRLYCRMQHGTKHDLCNNCSELFQYASTKIDRCMFHENKPACQECVVHCYAKEQRERIKIIMRFAGPRMMFHHPYLGIMHFVDKYRFKASQPPKKNRQAKA
jgi:hypothetical protein